MRWLRLLCGVLVAAAVSAWLAVVEVLWLPWRLGGVLVPVSVVAAVGGNLLLVAAGARLSASRLVGAVPAVVWLVVVLASSVRRAEGDLLVAAPAGDTVAGVVDLAFLLGGVLAASFAVGRMVGRAPRAGRPARPGDRG